MENFRRNNSPNVTEIKKIIKKWVYVVDESIFDREPEVEQNILNFKTGSGDKHDY